MAGGNGKEKSKILTAEDTRSWEVYDRILVTLDEILTRPQAAKNIRVFMKEKLPLMLDEVLKRDGRIEK